jgi:NADPH-dependent curcumin reductase CurA
MVGNDRVNRQVTLAVRPVGEPRESDFALVEAPVVEPEPGQVLVKTLWLSLDPYQRGRMSEARSYARPVELGEVMAAEAVAEVVESRSSRLNSGDVVVGPFGWQEYAVADAHRLRRNQERAEGPRDLRFLIVSRARMQGFLVTDFAHRYEEALRRLAPWVGEGRLRYREDVVEGLERAPRAFIGLFRGENRGKLLVKVSEPGVG